MLAKCLQKLESLDRLSNCSTDKPYIDTDVTCLLHIFWILLEFNILVWSVHVFQVNGDTLFMTGNFKEFKVESHENNSWDERNAMSSTAVCILFKSETSKLVNLSFLDINVTLHVAGLPCQHR